MSKRGSPISRSLNRKLIIPIAFMMILQGVLYFCAILGAGTLTELNRNAFGLFQHAVENRKVQLETMMVKKWSLPENFEGVIKVAQDELIADDGGIKENPTVSTAMADQLVLLLRNSSATGAFVIYDDVEGKGRHSCFYLRDMEPSVYSKDNADLLVSYGSGRLVSEMGLTMDYTWTSNMEFDNEYGFARYYEEIRQEANKGLALASKDIGRWSGALRLSPDGEDIMVYCMPLLDEKHTMYGVVGIEIALDYLCTLLPYQELLQNSKSGYILAVLGENGSYKSVAENSHYFENLEQTGHLRLNNVRNGGAAIYSLENERLAEPALATVLPLRLYNYNTPFEQEQWVLLGVTDEKSLLAPGIRLKYSLFWAFVGALAIGVVFSVLSTYIFSRPIQAMAKHLQTSSTDEGIRLPRVYVTEIDRLAEAVEKYSTDVANSASRLSQILHIMNQPLGAIEYDKESKIVYCTGQVGNLLKFSDGNRGRLMFTVEEFNVEIEQYKTRNSTYSHEDWDGAELNHQDGIREKIYQSTDEDDKPCWISFKTVEQQNRCLTVVQDVTEEISEKLKIEYERDYDILTSLLNRRSFRKRVVRMMDTEVKNDIGAMVMWDLDNLKSINDTYGHDFGDTYICEAAKVLHSLSSDRVIVSRMSGDEFLVFFYGFSSKHEILNIVKAAHNQLRQTILWLPGNENVSIRASAGVVWYPEHNVSFEQLIKYADFAMYSAKGNVKGEIREFDYENYRRDELLFNSKDELNRFIDEKQMRFKFQPIVNARDGSIFAYEALMRPNGDNVKSIVEMMRLAKAQSKLNQIEFMTFMGVMEAFRWQRDAFGNAKLFFNSIPNNRLSMEDFATFKRRFGDDLGRVVIEITEEERLNGDCLYFKQSHLKQWGVQIAIDDFVSDMNTEVALQSLAPQYIKIDVSITHHINKNERQQNKVAEMLAYAKPRNIKVIAEGVESKEEMEMLMGMGVDYLQGYYIGRPSFEVRGIDAQVVEAIQGFYVS